MSLNEILKTVEDSIAQKIEDEKQVRGRTAIKQLEGKHVYGYAMSIGIQILRQCNCPLELAYPLMRFAYRALEPSLKGSDNHDYGTFRHNILLKLKDVFSEIDRQAPPKVSCRLNTTNISSVKHRGARMEDNFIYVPNLRDLTETDKSRDAISLFAVLDGHNGSEAAEHCAALLVETAVAQLCREGRTARDFLGDVFQIMEASLVDCRAQFRWSGGTTCTVCVIEHGRIHTAWMGDSFAWLYFKEGPPLILTDRLHRPTVPEERALVQNNGGWISDSNPPRVCGLLGITRSLGDSHLKVCSLPSMTSVQLRGDEVCLTIASDGLWDAKGCAGDNPELMELLRSADRQHMAERVSQRAIACGSNDNITVGIVWLDEGLPSCSGAGPSVRHGRCASDLGARVPRFSSPPRDLLREING